MHEQIKETAAYYGISNAETIRRAITAMYEDYQRKRFGYKGVDLAKVSTEKAGTKKALDLKVENMRLKSDDELTEYLTDIGYFEPDTVSDVGEYIQHRIMTNDTTKEREYWQLRFNPRTKSYSYKAQIFSTFDELIKDLRKSKFL